jgi:hypothetical protein
MSYLIATSEIPNHRYEFFAKEMGISKTVFKKKIKTHSYIQLYWQSWHNAFKVTFHGNYSGEVVPQSDYEDLKYKLMVVEETPEEEKYRKLQNTTDWIKNSSTEEFVSTIPEPLEKMVQNPQKHPSLGDVLMAMNYIFNH